MPTVDGQKFAYTPAGRRAAAAARRAKGNPGATGAKPMGSRLGAARTPRTARAPRIPRTKGSMMGKGYNFTRNINGGELPDIGY